MKTIKFTILQEDCIDTNYLDHENCAACKAYRRTFNDNNSKLNNGVVDMRINGIEYDCTIFNHSDFVDLRDGKISKFDIELTNGKEIEMD